MDEHIAYCGLHCHTYPILLATNESDPAKKHELRIQIAQQIEQHYGTRLTPEEIGGCDGCRQDNGRLNCKQCLIRDCARERGVKNCAYCDDYACDKLEEFFTKEPGAKQHLNEIRNNMNS